MPSQMRSKSRKESKTEKLSRILREYRAIQEKINKNDHRISELEKQYQVDADGRYVYKKSTHDKLSAAYDKEERYKVQLQAKHAEYAAAEAERDYSSGEESKSSTRSSNSSQISGSSKSSAPPVIGWDCGRCRRSNLNDPWGPQRWCGCGHEFCETDGCCSVQWNPVGA